jgi:hypothetical protein
MALKTMSVARLQDLKSQVEAAITAKVSERRRELETELSKLGRPRRRPKGHQVRSDRSDWTGGTKVPQPRKPD